jgi:hypothetical protein
VFVSSTLGELADERQAASRAISALRLTPVTFEAGARPYPPRDLYRPYLARGDVFVGLYGQRYGWVGPGMEISGLAASARLEFVDGDPQRAALLAGAVEGLRRRVGPRALPLLRQGEAELIAQIRQALGADQFNPPYDACSRLSQQEAVAAVRGRGAGTADP